MSQSQLAEKALALKRAQGDFSRRPDLFPGQDDQDVLLTRAEAAVYLRRSVPTLEAWARDGTGPVVVRMGPRSVRYRLSDLRRFVQEGVAA